MDQLHYGMSPPGLIERAWCFSFFLGDDALYAVVVAKGWRVGYAPRGFAEQLGTKFGYAWAQSRTDEGYAKLQESSLQNVMAENKRSYKALYSSITDLITNTQSANPTLQFTVDGKKHKYTFDGPSAEEAAAFFQALAARIS